MRIPGLIWAAVLLTTAATHASAHEIESFMVGNWRGPAYNDDRTNAFTGCSIGASFVNGSTLFINVGPAGAPSLGFFCPQWMLTPGSVVSGQIKIDDRYFSPFVGSAANAQLVSIPFSATDPIFEALRRGEILTVTSNAGNAEYSLRDTARALDSARMCVDK